MMLAAQTFHLTGLCVQFFRPVLCGKVAMMYPPMEPAPPMLPTPDNIIEHAHRTGANSMLAVPSFVEAWAGSPKAIEYLKTLEFVVSLHVM
jgi:acyl-coenzyme A synthetase/AMP-(fatty) acid ligase